MKQRCLIERHGKIALPIVSKYHEIQKFMFRYHLSRPVYTLVIFEVSPPTSDEQLGILAVVSQKFPNDEIR